jgi:hypothetical protein
MYIFGTTRKMKILIYKKEDEAIPPLFIGGF